MPASIQNVTNESVSVSNGQIAVLANGSANLGTISNESRSNECLSSDTTTTNDIATANNQIVSRSFGIFQTIWFENV